MEKRTKVFLIIAIICVCSAFKGWNAVRAESEQASSIAMKDGIEVNTGEAGILVIQNEQDMGTLELICDHERQMVSCDYSELELPLEHTCIMIVHPHTGFTVESVLINGESWEGRDDVYRIGMSEALTTVQISYRKSADQNFLSDGNSSRWTTTPAGVCENSTKSEGPDKIARNPSGSNTRNSVSAISYDVKVTYLDGREDSDITGNEKDDANDKAAVNGKDDMNDKPAAKEQDIPEIEEEHAEDERITPNDEEIEGSSVISADVPILANEYGEAAKTPEVRVQTTGFSGENLASEEKKLQEVSVKKAVGEVSAQEKRHSLDFDDVGEEKTVQTIKTKSVQIISILPLYLFLSCCMIIVRLVKS